MSHAVVDAIARAVLYEGVSLYPYRPTSLKNRRPLLFGTLFPPAWAAARGENDPAEAFVEHLVSGATATVRVMVRFLRLGDPIGEEVVDCEEGITFFDRGDASGRVEVTVTAVRAGLHRVRVHVACNSDVAPDVSRAVAERAALGAAHVVVRAREGVLVSMIDPPPACAADAAACARGGLHPVLAGDALLASPIALEDHPRLAPESQGDLFDATEIEEILCLRVQTLTDAEKAEIRAAGGPSARLLARVEALSPEVMMGLHGARRAALAVGTGVTIRPVRDTVGTRRARSDAMDVVLAGLRATIVSVEITAEGERLFCVTIDDDPGRDLGDRGFPGHRFFFREDELEVHRAAPAGAR